MELNDRYTKRLMGTLGLKQRGDHKWEHPDPEIDLIFTCQTEKQWVEEQGFTEIPGALVSYQSKAHGRRVEIFVNNDVLQQGLAFVQQRIAGSRTLAVQQKAVSTHNALLRWPTGNIEDLLG